MLGAMYRPFAVGALATLLGILFVVALASSAHAQDAGTGTAPQPAATAPPEVSSEVRTEARSHFEKGLSLFDEEAWDAALVEFARSRALFPTRAATKDAGFCLRKLHRFDEALDMFESLLNDFPNLPADDKEIAQREVRSLAALVGRIELTGAEPGATVVIDSRTRGSFPVAPVRVSIGTHLVRVLKDGFVPFEANVTVASGQTTPVAVKLAPLMQGGRLKVVEQTGKVVDVLVDNVTIGKTPWEGTLPVGQHSVALVGEGELGTQPAQAPVRLDEVTALSLAVENLDATLRVDPKPIGASVAIDGVIVGRGLWVGRLRSGTHRLEVGEEGFLGATEDITLAHGAHESHVIELVRDPRASLTFKEAEAIRQEWLHRGGSMLTYEVRGQGLVIVGGAKTLRNGYASTGWSPSTGPSYFDDTSVSPGDFSGGGAGGPGLRVSYMYMALPDPSKGSGVWHALRFGTGADIAFGYWFTSEQAAEPIAPSAVPAPYTPPAGTVRTIHYQDGAWRTGWMLNVPVTVGYQLAVGTFKGPTWDGVVMGVAWTPSLNVLMPYQFEKATYFVPYGFEASVDIVKGMMSKERDAYGKVFVYVLPPIKDSFTVISIGGGAAWY
jgi:hypothetical protein